MICDGRGRPVAFRLVPGQAHELPEAEPLLAVLPRPPRWVVADKGYAAHRLREAIWGMGARPAIPAKSNEAPVRCPAWIYNNRHHVENSWARLKEWRAVATRCEKTAASFAGVLCFAAAVQWIKT